MINNYCHKSNKIKILKNNMMNFNKKINNLNNLNKKMILMNPYVLIYRKSKECQKILKMTCKK